MILELDAGTIGTLMDLIQREIEYHDTPDDQDTVDMYEALQVKLKAALAGE